MYLLPLAGFSIRLWWHLILAECIRTLDFTNNTGPHSFQTGLSFSYVFGAWYCRWRRLSAVSIRESARNILLANFMNKVTVLLLPKIENGIDFTTRETFQFGRYSPLFHLTVYITSFLQRINVWYRKWPQGVMVYRAEDRGRRAPSNVATGTSLPNYTASRPWKQ